MGERYFSRGNGAGQAICSSVYHDTQRNQRGNPICCAPQAYRKQILPLYTGLLILKERVWIQVLRQTQMHEGKRRLVHFGEKEFKHGEGKEQEIRWGRH